KYLSVLLRQAFLLQRSLRPVPLINPIDHPQQCKSRCPGGDGPLRSPRALDFGDDVLQEMYVIFLARVNALAKRWRQGMVLVKHDCNLTITLAQHNGDVAPNERPQPLLRVRNGLNRCDDPLLGYGHGVIHQFEKDLVLTLEVMVKDRKSVV